MILPCTSLNIIFITISEFLRLSFSDDVWSEEDSTRTPSQENLQRTNLTKTPRTNQETRHVRALSAREESTRRRLINQKLYKSLKQANNNNNSNNTLHKIRKTRSVDELEIGNKFIVSPIKEQDNVNFDSKLQIKPMLNKKISFKVNGELITVTGVSYPLTRLRHITKAIYLPQLSQKLTSKITNLRHLQ